MSTKTQTANYDRGYEDALEGRKPRSKEHWYQRGYESGREYVCEIDAERADIMNEWSAS